jgi:hypothetical protein
MLGPEHQEVALLLPNLGEQALPSDRSDLAVLLNGLANLFRMQESNEQAATLYQWVLAMWEGQPGQQHPVTAQMPHDLAVVRPTQGPLHGALVLTIP